MAIKIHHLRPAPGSKTPKTRVGRGQGSKGKTAGRGTKGTKARYQVPASFEGGQMPIHMRLPKLKGIFERIEQWTMTKTKFEAMDILNKDDIPCGPILSMKELIEDQSLRATGTIVEVDHPERGKYFSVGNPIKMSDSPSEVTRSPLLGEHTDEVLRQVLGFSDHQVAEIHDSGALDPPRKQAAE